MFGLTISLLSLLRLVFPQVFITEQVMGFKQKMWADYGQSYLDVFIAMVMGITKGGQQWFAGYLVIGQDIRAWVDGSRARLILHYFD